MSTEEQQIVEKKVPHGEDDDSDEDDHNHEGHDHEGHDHEGHKHGEDKDGKKANRGEKKFKKAMIKLGMKPVTGITRVTIRKGKSLLLYIDDPEVFKSPGVENSYIIFGEPKMNDFQQNLGADEAKKFKDSDRPEVAQLEKKQETSTNATAGDEDVDEAGIPAESIKMIMDHCACDRKVAVSALKESGNDTVNAILKIMG